MSELQRLLGNVVEFIHGREDSGEPAEKGRIPAQIDPPEIFHNLAPISMPRSSSRRICQGL